MMMDFNRNRRRRTYVTRLGAGFKFKFLFLVKRERKRREPKRKIIITINPYPFLDIPFVLVQGRWTTFHTASGVLQSRPPAQPPRAFKPHAANHALWNFLFFYEFLAFPNRCRHNFQPLIASNIQLNAWKKNKRWKRQFNGLERRNREKTYRSDRCSAQVRTW